jgi:hypothetical protein
MKTIITSGLQTEELNRWHGTRAAIWMFDVSHRRLALLLFRPDAPEALYIVGVGCEWITGPFSWDMADLRLAHGEHQERVTDAKAGFELRCSSVTLVKSASVDPSTSFEGFLGEEVPDSLKG